MCCTRKRLAALNPLLGLSLPDTRPYRLSAALRQANGMYTVSDLKGNIGSTDITGELQWRRAEERPLLKGRLASRSLHIQDLSQDLSAGPRPRTAGRPELDVLDRPVPLDWLAAIDAELELDVQRVIGAAVPVRNAVTTAKLSGRGLTLSPWRATLAGTPVTGNLAITLGERAPTLRLTAQARRLDLGDLLRQLAADAPIQGRLEDLTLAVNSRGRTVRTLLKGANLSLKTQRGRVSSGNDKPGTPWSIDIAAAEIEARRDQPIAIRVDGKHRDTPFALTTNIVTLEGLAKGTRPWPLGVSLRALQANLTATGRVTHPFQGNGFDLTFELTGEDLKKLDPLIDYVIPLRGEYRVTGHFSDHADSYDFSDIQARVGQSDIGGSIVFAVRKPRRKITARLRSGMIHYDDLEFVESAGEPEATGRVIPEFTLPVEALRAVDLDVDLAARRIRMARGDLGDLVLNATLENGRSVWAARVTNDIGGQLNFRHQVDVNTDPPVNDLLLTARGLNYGLILTTAGVAEVAEGRVDVDVALAGPGATQRSLDRKSVV